MCPLMVTLNSDPRHLVSCSPSLSFTFLMAVVIRAQNICAFPGGCMDDARGNSIFEGLIKPAILKLLAETEGDTAVSATFTII
jgi:hypothetical protein